jgi:hypothetical protein
VNALIRFGVAVALATAGIFLVKQWPIAAYFFIGWFANDLSGDIAEAIAPRRPQRSSR